MAVSVKPSPSVSVSDIVDSSAGNTIIRRYRVLALPCGKPSLDFASRLVSDFSSDIPLTSCVRSMENRISHVLGSSCPSQVGRVYAAAMAVTARMRSIMVCSWRRAIDALTDDARSEMLATINGNSSISLDIAIRPENTLIGCGSQRKFQERQTTALWRPSTKWTSMASVSLPMRCAPSLAIVRLAAIWNRAYSLISHSDLYERLAWLERAAVLEAPGAFAFCSTETARCKP